MPNDDIEDAEGFESLVGVQLREARVAKGIGLDDIAKSTRIPLRKLENIENAEYDALPAPTYAIGFVKAYARAVGLDQNIMARQFRDEISYRSHAEAHTVLFEPTDPARVPPRSLAWIAAAIALILVIGYLIWRSGFFEDGMADRARLAAEGGETPAAQPAGEGPAAAPAAQQPVAARGPVILEARDTVWFRVYDLESGDRIHEAEIGPGERYTVPSDALHPAIRTSRADALRVTVGGRAVAPLGPPQTIISDVSLLPQDLVARRAAAETESAAPARPTTPAPRSPRPGFQNVER